MVYSKIDPGSNKINSGSSKIAFRTSKIDPWRLQNQLLDDSGGALEALGDFFAILDALVEIFGHPWGHLEGSWDLLEASWELLEASWELLEASWDPLGRVLELS